MLFDSMISYIARSNKEKEDENYDEEETEDVRKSEGREKVKSQKSVCHPQKKALETEQRITKMFDKYIAHLESVALLNGKVKNEISQMEAIKKFMTAIFFLYRTFSYRFTIELEGNDEHTLIKLIRSSQYRKTATEYVFRITSLFALYLMKSKLIAEENSALKKKIESYRQYAFELCLAVFSICDWLNEGNVDYKEWSTSYKPASLMTLQRVLGAKIDKHTPTDVFKRLDRSVQELDGFDKTVMQQYIHENISLIAGNGALYPSGNLLWTEQFGYVFLKAIKPNMAILLTTAFGFNKCRGGYCPDYLFLYDRMIILPVKKR